MFCACICACTYTSSKVGANVGGRLGDASDWLKFCGVKNNFCAIFNCLLENEEIFNWCG